MVRSKDRIEGSSIFVHSVLIICALIIIIPFITILSISISRESDIVNYGYNIIPKSIDLLAYRFVFKNPLEILNAYKISFIVTIIGTVLGVMMMAITGYCLARRNFRYRKLIMFYIFFTMLFNGGLVPYYILLTQYLHLTDTIWALILPGLVNTFHIVLLRTFFQNLPQSLFESAKLDGADEMIILLRIAFPLSTPALATVALLGALGRWNDWFNALLFIRIDKLMPLQYLLYKIMADLQFISTNMTNIPQDVVQVPGETVRMAMCIIAAGPMMFIFPFFQKYFVEGLTVGSLKE